jgi:hypothetical protein
MNKPDLLITWIKHCDYPIFREFLVNHSNFFNKIIIYWSEHNRFPYFDHFIQDAIRQDVYELFDHPEIIFLDPIETDWGKEDWRNKSTNYMLHFSESEWVCSIEQDWFSNDWNKLLTATQEAMKDNDLVGWWQENNEYIHPSYWFIKRNILDQTNKDFSARDGQDHFGWISKDVIKMNGKIKTTQQMGFVDFKDCFHLGGVNQNYLEGMKKDFVFHRPEIFYVYNYWCQKAEVTQDSRFTQISSEIHRLLNLPIDPENCEWTQFFK